LFFIWSHVQRTHSNLDPLHARSFAKKEQLILQINAPTTKAAVAPNFEYRPKDKILQAKSFAVRHLRTTADMIKICQNAILPRNNKISLWKIRSRCVLLEIALHPFWRRRWCNQFPRNGQIRDLFLFILHCNIAKRTVCLSDRVDREWNNSNVP